MTRYYDSEKESRFGTLKVFSFVLDALNDGKVIRTSIALGLRVLGVLTAAAGIYLLVELLKLSFQLPTEGTIGGLLLSIVILVGIAGVVQIYFYRANSVQKLSDSQFTVIPIFSILFRCFGEIYSLLALSVGVGGCIFIWLAGMNPMYLLGRMGSFLPSMSTEGTFLGGAAFLFYLSFLAFIILIVFYFLAESVEVLTDIAKNIRLLVEQKKQETLPVV